MATISSSVQMYDNMSPVINGITSALNICISSFESMQSASGHSIDTASLEAARQHLASAGSSFNQIEQNINNAGNGQQNFNNKIIESQNSVDGLITKVKALVGAYAGFETLKKVIDTSDEMTQIGARLNMMNDGLQTTAELQDKIFQSAQRSRASYTNTAESIAKMGLNAKMAFGSNDELIAFMEQINKQFVIGGASVEETKNAMIQLTQAMGAGALRGEELNSILDAAPEIARAIEKSMSWAEGSIKQYAEKGLVTADVVKKAMFKTADETEQRFNSMPKTFGQIAVMMKNEILKNSQPLLTRINEIVNNPNVSNFGYMIVNGFNMISIAALNIINIISNIAAFFQSNWGMIEPLIMGIVAAFLAYNGVLLINNIYTGITTALKTTAAIAAVAHGAAITAEMLATTGMTEAQLAFNAALYANPITWIIILIIALVTIFYVAIAALNKFAGTSISATGTIAGVFMALGAVIYNVIAFVWNIIAAFVEFFANAFTNPAEANKRLFLNLNLAIINGFLAATKGCDTFATNFANAILTGINIAIEGWNNFVDILNSFGGIADAMGLGKGTEFEYTASISSDLSNAKSLIESELSKPVDNYTSVPRMESLDIGAQFNKGYAWGSSVDDWASKLLNPQQQDMGSGYDYNDLLNKAANNTGDTAKNTKDIKDKLDITDEDLKYLRDIASDAI